MNELRSQAPPMPSTSGQGVREYINVHQAISQVITRMEQVGYESLTYQVPTVRQRQAYFDRAGERYAELTGEFRTLETAIGAR